MADQRPVGAVGVVERHRIDREALIAGRLAMGGAAMVAHDTQHVLAVRRKAREGAELAGHLGRGAIGDAGHDGGQRAGQRPALGAVIGNAHGHQEAADIGVAEAERAVLVGEFGNLARGELGHQHRDFEHHRPQAAEVLIALHVEPAGVGVVELQQVGRGQVAGRVVEEHVFRARVGRPDRACRGAGVPVVHRRVEMQARIGGRPGGMADLFPELAGFEGLHRLAGDAGDQVPVAVGLHGAQEVVLQGHRIVRVLAGDRQIGVRIPVGVIGREVDVLVALAGELDHPLDVVVGHHGLARGPDLALQRRVHGRVEAAVAIALAVHAGLHDGLEVPGIDLRAGDEARHLLLLDHLPVDIGLDIGVIGIDHHHLGGAARRAARLDRAGGAVADLQEAHQAGRAAAASELFALAAQIGEVRAGAGAVFEQARLAHPQVHDAALVDEVVGDRLDEAGMRLGMLVGRLRLDELAGLEIDVVVALAGAVDAIGPVQAGVEPLRRVRRHHLHGEHVAQFVVERLGIGLGFEIAALPAPIGPGAGEAIEDLGGRGLTDPALLLRQLLQRLLVGDRAPQPGRDRALFDLLQARRHAGLAEILLGEDVGGDLAPGVGHRNALEAEHDRTVGIADLGRGRSERDVSIGRLARLGVSPFDAHRSRPSSHGRELCSRSAPRSIPGSRVGPVVPGPLAAMSPQIPALHRSCIQEAKLIPPRPRSAARAGHEAPPSAGLAPLRARATG